MFPIRSHVHLPHAPATLLAGRPARLPSRAASLPGAPIPGRPGVRRGQPHRDPAAQRGEGARAGRRRPGRGRKRRYSQVPLVEAEQHAQQREQQEGQADGHHDGLDLPLGCKETGGSAGGAAGCGRAGPHGHPRFAARPLRGLEPALPGRRPPLLQPSPARGCPVPPHHARVRGRTPPLPPCPGEAAAARAGSRSPTGRPRPPRPRGGGGWAARWTVRRRVKGPVPRG